LRQPSQRCGSPDETADLFRFRTADGVELDGAMVGTGSIGVVLAHQYPADLCGWWPYANYLAGRGFRVLLFDFRCFGASDCPAGDARWDLTPDLQAASDQLRTQGARSVALVGASLGGAAVLIAGSRVAPRASSVVELSGEPDLQFIGAPLRAGTAVRRLRVPTLFVVARGDTAVSAAQTTRMWRDTPAATKSLMILPSYAGHGWSMLTTTLTHWAPLARRIATFIRTQAAET
jgi:pimeloyl-ACP methyl ester carboxylesterase